MSDRGIGFRRVVVGLAHGSASQAAVEAAAEFAEFLNIELLAAFVADATLPALAELSGARELRVLEREWQTIDRARIERDTEGVINVARRRFAQGIGGRAIRTSFDVLAGAEAIAALIRADDIVAIIEPAHPAERVTWQFTALLEAAFATAGAVLMVPRRIVRAAGPIVTVASDSDEAVVRAALQIAAVFKERLIVVTAAGMRLSRQLLAGAGRLGVEIEHIARGGPSLDTLQLVASLRFGERLRILPGGVWTDDAARLLSQLQGIPLLVIDHRRAGSAAPEQKRSKVNNPAD